MRQANCLYAYGKVADLDFYHVDMHSVLKMRCHARTLSEKTGGTQAITLYNEKLLLPVLQLLSSEKMNGNSTRHAFQKMLMLENSDKGILYSGESEITSHIDSRATAKK